jgi:hypothetical protein
VKLYLPWILLLCLTGCCRVAELPRWPAESESDTASALYRFRLERSGTAKFSGLLALKPRTNGMWSALLDATGAPLAKMIIHPDGSTQVEYRAAAIRDTRLPELLGKLVEYIYFTPASAECSRYAFSCVCLEQETPEQAVKWKRLGPLRLWEVEQTTTALQERITVHLKLSSILVHLERMDGEAGK